MPIKDKNNRIILKLSTSDVGDHMILPSVPNLQDGFDFVFILVLFSYDDDCGLSSS